MSDKALPTPDRIVWKPVSPEIMVLGPAAIHTQACAVHHDRPLSAVLDLSVGVFQPSWAAQSDGWRLVQAKSWMQRKALQWLWPR